VFLNNRPTVFTYRYFLHRFPQLCILAIPLDSDEPIGCVVGKVDDDEEIYVQGSPKIIQSGYIGMLVSME
jgi:N-alpha-acetyltransferase 30